MRDQVAREFRMAVEHGIVQSPPVVAITIDHGTMLKQPLDGLHVVIPGRELQRLLAIPVRAPWIGTALDK